MTAQARWEDAPARLTAALHLDVAPIAITFSPTAVDTVPPFADMSAPMPEPTADGCTGAVLSPGEDCSVDVRFVR